MTSNASTLESDYSGAVFLQLHTWGSHICEGSHLWYCEFGEIKTCDCCMTFEVTHTIASLHSCSYLRFLQIRRQMQATVTCRGIIQRQCGQTTTIATSLENGQLWNFHSCHFFFPKVTQAIAHAFQWHSSQWKGWEGKVKENDSIRLWSLWNPFMA